jgi:hypothetical protein
MLHCHKPQHCITLHCYFQKVVDNSKPPMLFIAKYRRLLAAWALLCLIFFLSEKMRLGKTKTTFHYLRNLLSKTFNSEFMKVKLTILYL